MLGALIVAAAAAGLLVVAARAESRPDTRVESRLETRVQTVGQAATVEQRLSLVARVVKPFGGTVRVLPSSDAAIMFNARCGDDWPVLAVDSGWVKVQTDRGTGWIGGGRVAVRSAPASVDCSDARLLIPSGYVSTFVPAGCLVLRSRPSADAMGLDCVENGHIYAVLDGPFDPGTGDDWFKVTSPSTGTGWTLAENLNPT